MFKHLFSPIRIGRMTLKNRIFQPGHGTRLTHDGSVGDELLAYHEARAAAGVSMIITEVQNIPHHTAGIYPKHLLLGSASAKEGLQKLAKMCAKYDCRVLGQLFHPGRLTEFSADGSQIVSYAPSEVADEYFKNVPCPLTTEEVWEVIDSYGDGARLMAQAGLDGVEILTSMGYLLSQFLNPRINRREDEFGGSFENRMRLIREIIRSVRKKAGAEITVGIRISGDEMDPGALSVDEILPIIAALGTDGGLDYINVIAGTAASYRGHQHIVPDMSVSAAYLAPFAKKAKEVVSLPVLTAGRMTQPQDAERIIASGAADMIGIVRENISDPEYVKKAREGRPEDIRACIGCNQACIGHGNRGFSISCIQYPESGREMKYAKKDKVSKPKNVVIVGGGPGGMKAAIVAAQRGHRVTLYEKERQLGGQVLMAQLLPGRAEFGGLATNLIHELGQQSVTVNTGVEVTADMIKSQDPDKLIIATGAAPNLPSVDGVEDAPVVDCWSVIRGQANVGHSVVIWDWRCDWVGMGVAMLLAKQGCRVRLAVNGIVPGERIPRMVRDQMVGEMHKLGIEVIPYVRLEGVDSDTAYFQHVTSNQPVILSEMDTLVSNHPRRRNATLADSLRGSVKDMSLIGDCLAPRTAEEAVLEGLKVAMAI